jgi:D-alanyl-D-alanine carboxypeptidase/D-alanyl-D-alanine-endopeptidase (penicillin-binding protein 4)
MTVAKDYQAFYDSLPVAGVDGTLKHRFAGTKAQGSVHAKTGSLTGACTLSGYLKADDGHAFDFVILMNNYPGKTADARAIQDKLVLAMIGDL